VRSIFAQYLPSSGPKQTKFERSQRGSTTSLLSEGELREYSSITKDLRHLYSMSPVDEEPPLHVCLNLPFLT
jgi:hypothetical protein